MMKPAVHIMVQRDAWQYGKALIDAVEHVKNAPIKEDLQTLLKKNAVWA
jgi:hypothetical protein